MTKYHGQNSVEIGRLQKRRDVLKEEQGSRGGGHLSKEDKGMDVGGVVAEKDAVKVEGIMVQAGIVRGRCTLGG